MPEIEERICPICGRTFKPRRESQRFDSAGCRFLAQKDYRDALARDDLETASRLWFMFWDDSRNEVKHD